MPLAAGRRLALGRRRDSGGAVVCRHTTPTRQVNSLIHRSAARTVAQHTRQHTHSPDGNRCTLVDRHSRRLGFCRVNALDIETHVAAPRKGTLGVWSTRHQNREPRGRECKGTGGRTNMHVVVRFGDKEDEVFNANCWCISLLDNIREKCQCPTDMEVELSDENGHVKHLSDLPYRYASELLQERERLVLLRVERGDDDDLPTYVPLLKDQDYITDAFIAHLSSDNGSREWTGKDGRPLATKASKQSGFDSSRSLRSTNSRNSHRNSFSTRTKMKQKVRE